MIGKLFFLGGGGVVGVGREEKILIEMKRERLFLKHLGKREGKKELKRICICRLRGVQCGNNCE